MQPWSAIGQNWRSSSWMGFLAGCQGCWPHRRGEDSSGSARDGQMDSPESSQAYDPGCRQCPRLAGFLDAVLAANPGYFCKPVPPFGDPNPRMLIVGLAPGLHGANRTGRPFTGDACSNLLYGTLYRLGLSSAPRSLSTEDGLALKGCRITNAVKCLPPANKPTGPEVRACGQFLHAELLSTAPRVIVCLGSVSPDAVLRSLALSSSGRRASEFRFAHGARHLIEQATGSVIVFDSYHPSRYNVNTGRLTQAMFEAALGEAARLAGLSHV